MRNQRLWLGCLPSGVRIFCLASTVASACRQLMLVIKQHNVQTDLNGVMLVLPCSQESHDA